MSREAHPFAEVCAALFGPCYTSGPLPAMSQNIVALFSDDPISMDRAGAAARDLAAAILGPGFETVLRLGTTYSGGFDADERRELRELAIRCWPQAPAVRGWHERHTLDVAIAQAERDLEQLRQQREDMAKGEVK